MAANEPMNPEIQLKLENSPKKICKLIGLKPCFYETIRLWAQDFYNAIVDEGAAQVNYELSRIEIYSE